MGEDGKWQTDDIASNLIAHAILGAVVVELQGNSGLAGGAGAVVGEVAADIIRKQLYGKEVKDLTEEEKQTISALSQNITGKLDKDYFESVYGKENVQQGGGNYKETKDNINNNHAANQQANKNSNFDEHVVNEKGLGNAGKQSNKFEPTTLSELHSDLISKCFQLKGTSTGGYTTYKHPDGRIVTVKPTGQVIPTKPKIAGNGKKYNERTDYEFNRLKDQSHSTGHFINRGK